MTNDEVGQHTASCHCENSTLQVDDECSGNDKKSMNKTLS